MQPLIWQNYFILQPTAIATHPILRTGIPYVVAILSICSVVRALAYSEISSVLFIIPISWPSLISTTTSFGGFGVSFQLVPHRITAVWKMWGLEMRGAGWGRASYRLSHLYQNLDLNQHLTILRFVCPHCSLLTYSHMSRPTACILESERYSTLVIQVCLIRPSCQVHLFRQHSSPLRDGNFP